jgi:hypothetical protein
MYCSLFNKSESFTLSDKVAFKNFKVVYFVRQYLELQLLTPFVCLTISNITAVILKHLYNLKNYHVFLQLYGVIVNCITTIITCDFIHISTCTGSNSKVYPSTNLLTNMTYLGIMNRPDRAWKCQCGTVMPRLTYLRCTNCDADKNTGESLLHKKGDWSCPKCGCNNFAKRTECYRCKEKRTD